MQACGNTPPIKVKSIDIVGSALLQSTEIRSDKDKYIGSDRDRLAKLFNIPIIETAPEPFPPNTLPVQRALCIVESQHPDKLKAAFEALYQTFWIEGKPIGEPEVVAKSLASVFGEERAKDIVATTSKPEVKQHLNANTEKALNAGAFGVPYFVATDSEGKEDVFFGFDRLSMVADFLGLSKGKGESGFRALL